MIHLGGSKGVFSDKLSALGLFCPVIPIWRRWTPMPHLRGRWGVGKQQSCKWCGNSTSRGFLCGGRGLGLGLLHNPCKLIIAPRLGYGALERFLTEFLAWLHLKPYLGTHPAGGIDGVRGGFAHRAAPSDPDPSSLYRPSATGRPPVWSGRPTENRSPRFTRRRGVLVACQGACFCPPRVG